ncbi:MAG: hypothetical protein JWR65_3960, partial [Massilia sp.]|nr:hypothetical protein [Massilia sp.]
LVFSSIPVVLMLDNFLCCGPAKAGRTFINS